VEEKHGLSPGKTSLWKGTVMTEMCSQVWHCWSAVFSIIESRLRNASCFFSASMARCPLKIVPWQPRVPGVPWGRLLDHPDQAKGADWGWLGIPRFFISRWVLRKKARLVADSLGVYGFTIQIYPGITLHGVHGIQSKSQASQNYVNRMWENLLLAFIGEESELECIAVDTSWEFMIYLGF